MTRRRDPSIKPVPLSSLGTDETLRCTCNQCRHEKFLSAAVLIDRLGGDYPIPRVSDVLRCAACGIKGDASVEIDWTKRMSGVTGHMPGFVYGSAPTIS